MKSFKEIQRSSQKGDYTRVAQMVGTSPSTVRMVVGGYRIDYYNIQKVCSDILEHREKINEREDRRRKKQAARELKLQAA